MRKRLILSLVLAVFGTVAASAQESAAQTAATAWLALVDAGDYAGSWNTAATPFKSAVTAEKWATAVKGARDPLGKLETRTLSSATATKSLPGAPDGDYVVLKFDTKYEHKAAAAETITAMHEADGAWRIAGYFVR
jgi:hypothetical protein